jgi:hypothetical protein
MRNPVDGLRDLLRSPSDVRTGPQDLPPRRPAVLAATVVIGALVLAWSLRVRPSEMITIALRPALRVIRGQISASEFELTKKWLDLNTDLFVDYRNGPIAYTEDAMDTPRPLPETERL